MRKENHVDVESLPIFWMWEELKDVIADSANRVIVVSAETGAGKSLSIFRILKELMREGRLPQGKAMLSQPLRATVDSLRSTIASIIEEEVGMLHGGEDGKDFRGEDWLIGTAGYLQFKVGTPDFLYYVWDEAHDERIEHVVLVGRLKRLLEENPNVKVIVMSATADINKYISFFGEDITAVVEVPGREYPREDTTEELSGSSFASQLDDFADMVVRHGKSRLAGTAYNALVFVPSPKYFELLQAKVQRGLPDFEVVTYWSKTPNKGYIIRGGSKERPTVCICTDTFRTGVTMHGIILSVSSGWQVRPFYDPQRKIGGTREELTDQDSVIQELGRAARLMAGFGVAVKEEERPEHAIPAIQRHALPMTVLRLKSMGENPRTFYWIDPPLPGAIDQAISDLKEIGALDESEELTSVGRAMTELNVEPHLGRMVLQASLEGCLEEVLVATTAVAGKGLLTNTKQYPDHEIPQQEFRDNESDYITAVKVWRAWCKEWQASYAGIAGKIRGKYKALIDRLERRAAKDNFDETQLREGIAGLRSEERKELADARIQAMKDSAYRRENGEQVWFQNGVYPKALMELAFDVVKNAENLQGVTFAFNGEKQIIRVGDLFALPELTDEQRTAIAKSVLAGIPGGLCKYYGRHAYQSFDGKRSGIYIFPGSPVFHCSPHPIWLVGEVETQRGKEYTYWVKSVQTVKPEWLSEVAPQACDYRIQDAHYVPSEDVVEATKVLMMNGAALAREEITLRGGEQAVKAFAEALGSGRVTEVLIPKKVEFPYIEFNKFVREEVADLNRRVQNQLGTIDSSVLTEWYVNKLGDVCTLAGAKDLNLNLTDADVSELLGIEDYAARREEIRSVRPDEWEIAGESYPLEYEWGWMFKGVKIYLPRGVIATVNLCQLPNWKGVTLRVYVADDGYQALYITPPDESLEDLANMIEIKRQELVWQAFKSDGNHGDYDRKVEVPYEESLSDLLEPTVWDTQTGAQAYPAYVHYTSYSGDDARTVWLTKWFKTEEEAQAARETAEAKKTEEDAAEYLRRNFEVLTAEAQTLYREVSGLWEQVDTEKAAAYGLSNDEVRTGWYTSEVSIPKRLETGKELAGLTGYRAQPTKALEILQNLKERLEQALAHFAENAEREPEARKTLDDAQVETAYIEEAYYNSEISYSEKDNVVDLLDDAQQAFDSGDYIKAIELAQKASEMAKSLNERVEANRRAQKAREEALTLLGQEKCRVCGQELGLRWDGDRHTCDWDHQPALGVWNCNQDADGNPNVLVAKVGNQTLARVEVVSYSDSEYDFYLRVNEDAVVVEGQEPKLEWLYKAPSERELELTSALHAAQAELARLEDELRQVGKEFTNRVQVTFQMSTGPKSQPQLQAYGKFTGSVENRKAEGGRSEYTNQTCLFVCRYGYESMPDGPKDGETWVATIAFQIGMRGGMPIIVVNPQVNVDLKPILQEEIARLEKELAAEAAKVDAFDDEGNPQTAMAAAFAEAGIV